MAGDGKGWPGRSSPAAMEVLQGMSGLLLVLFVWAHMFFESSILLGKEAMYRVTGLFEGRYFFDQPYPVLVTLIALAILVLVIIHAVIALNKFPAGYRQHRDLYRHAGSMRHGDTTLWIVQAASGFLLFFLLPVHLYTMIVEPENIGPYASSDRIWSQRYWILYALLLVTVHVHAGAGVYRLAMKWFPPDTTSIVTRRTLRRGIFALVTAFILLGCASLAAYMQIGAGHAQQAGERYVPPSSAPQDAGH
ncbi:MAG: fumarate reductase cytochrome b subunit [Halioglobus sp.]|nr:fumarate reductase cytochrome b subunit [Halioglobus sp.]